MHFIVFIFITLIDIQCNAGANKVVAVDIDDFTNIKFVS